MTTPEPPRRLDPTPAQRVEMAIERSAGGVGGSGTRYSRPIPNGGNRSYAHGIPAGGDSGQGLVKLSDDDYDVDWGSSGGGGITAFGFFVVDDTSAFTTDLSLQGHMTDDGSDPGFWQATPGPDYGVDVLVDGTWGAHMNIRIHDADPGDVFVADMTQGGGGENGLFAATFIADSTGVAKCGGPCAPARAFGFSYPLTLFQATVSQISGTGTAPDLQFFNMTMFKYA